MGSKPRDSVPPSKPSKPCRHRRATRFNGRASVSNKLEALKNLIPASQQDHDAEIKTDQLFKDTAEYIVLLKTQVLVLQKLVEYYGSSSSSSSS